MLDITIITRLKEEKHRHKDGNQIKLWMNLQHKLTLGNFLNFTSVFQGKARKSLFGEFDCF